MLIILGITAAAALGGIIYIFLAKDSTKIQKLAALGALILSGLALGICGAVLIFSNGAEEDSLAMLAPFGEVQETPQNSAIQYVLYIVILLMLFGFIIYIGIREQKRRNKGKIDKKEKKPGFSANEF